MSAIDKVQSQWQPYPNYKDSGIGWLEKVPSHWNILRLKSTISSVINGIWGEPPQEDDNDIICVRVADFQRDIRRVDISSPTLRSIPFSQRETRFSNLS